MIMQNEHKTIHTPWFFSVEEIFNKLDSNLGGLTEKEVQEKQKIYGLNILNDQKKTDFLKILIKQFTSPLIFILIAAAILTGFLHEWLNMSVIIGAVVINAILGFYQEYKAENTLDSLTTYIKDRTRVIRNKKEEEIDSALLVPGDIIEVSYGSRIPADGRIISATNLRIDESILTGESIPILKHNETLPESSIMAERKNMVYAGTLVSEGFAKAIIINTGKNTELGKIADVVSKTDRALTPIQKGIEKLSWYIFGFVIVIVLGIFILGISRGEPILQMLVLSSAVAVGAVPESLPIVLTVILSIGALRIANKKGIVRKLAAAETLGSATLIMTDKTGTLTQAKMKLMGIYPTEELFKKYTDESEKQIFDDKQKNILELAFRNSDIIIKNPESPRKEWDFVGRPFETNIAKACVENNIEIEKILQEGKTLEIPFNSTNKFSVAKNQNNYIVMGAPDVLLRKSNLNNEEQIKIEQWIHEASSSGKRLIAIGLLPKKENLQASEVENITFMGVLSFFDPIRPEVPEAIKRIEEHGVKVIIITGDLKGTAVSVAQSLGWEIKGNEILLGSDIKSMSDEELLEIIPTTKIFARTTPEDKLRIGNLYKRLGEIVGMTGDGVNDSPALKAMDIGISLGSGSDVAKSAADLVLLDDNFETISLAIDEGRKILTNVRKAFVYLMSNSLGAVFLVGGSLIFFLPMPLTALQIIWVNLFTGSLPSIAFAFEEHIEKTNKKQKKELLNNEVKVLALGVGTISSIMLFVLYYWMVKSNLEIDIVRSVFFACFAVYVLVISFSFRNLKKSLFEYDPFDNKKLNFAVAIGIVLLFATMSVPFMQKIFNIAPMPIKYSWIIILWSLINIFFVEIVKLIFRKR
jgi:Ca2+-transporting ATPase